MVRRRSPKPSARPSVRFEHVLVPTDLTARTEKALDVAATLAASPASRITLVHVIETIKGLSFDELKPFYRRLERDASAAMTRLSSRVPVQIDTAVVYGTRSEEIVKFAGAHDVDLIVLPSHRVNPSPVNRDWGTISYKVGLLAQCPVLLVK
jgi:universal stress protein A